MPSARRQSAMPEGPRGRELLRVVRGLTTDPLPVLSDLHERFGDVVGLAVPTAPHVMLFHPDDIERVLVGHAAHVNKGSIIRAMRPVLGDNLFTLEGAEHSRRRRIVNTIFRPRDISTQVDPVMHAAQRTTTRFSDGDTIDVLAATDHLTIDAIGHTLFGASIDDATDQIRELIHNLYRHLEVASGPAFRFTQHLPTRRMRTIHNDASALLQLVEQLAADRLQERGGAAPSHPDLLTLLTAARDDDNDGRLTHEQVIAELEGFLIAGHEPIALTLMWALWHLDASPDVRDQMLAEIDAASDGGPIELVHLEQLTFTRAVIDETIRMYGSTLIIRGLDAPVELSTRDVTLRRGWQTMSAMWHVHRDARWWPEPDTFMPNRFHERSGPVSPRYSYFPFGGGRRRCVGMHLALQSSVIALAELSRTWTFERTGPEYPGVTSQVLIRPCEPIMMRPRRRSITA